MVIKIINSLFIFVISFNLMGQNICSDSLQIFGTPEEIPKPELAIIQDIIISRFNDSLCKEIDSLDDTIWVTFCVDTSGRTRNVKIIKSLNSAINDEIINIVKEIIFEEPAKNRGVPVPYRCVIPIKTEQLKIEKKKPAKDCR